MLSDGMAQKISQIPVTLSRGSEAMEKISGSRNLVQWGGKLYVEEEDILNYKENEIELYIYV